MKWTNDWPVIGADPNGDGRGEPVIRHRKPDVGREYPVQALQTSDEFDDGDKLALQITIGFERSVTHRTERGSAG